MQWGGLLLPTERIITAIEGVYEKNQRINDRCADSSRDPTGDPSAFCDRRNSGWRLERARASGPGSSHRSVDVVGMETSVVGRDIPARFGFNFGVDLCQSNARKGLACAPADHYCTIDPFRDLIFERGPIREKNYVN